MDISIATGIGETLFSGIPTELQTLMIIMSIFVVGAAVTNGSPMWRTRSNAQDARTLTGTNRGLGR